MEPEVIKMLEKYPLLEIVLLSGIISQKTCRNILEIDRWLFADIYKVLVTNECVKGLGSGNFKATPKMLDYIKERRYKV